jgi:effector-binding domain-containing protein
MSGYEVVVKRVNPVRVFSVRGIVPVSDQRSLWRSLRLYLRERDVRSEGPWMSLYHDNTDVEGDEEDVEVCAPVATDVAPAGEVTAREVSGIETAATLVYGGPLAGILEGYAAIQKWISESGYHVVGRCREVYLRLPERGDQADPNAVVEIQFAVEKD